MSQARIVVHGGAGHGAKDQPGVDRAADAGWAILAAGGTALDAVLAAVEVMENDPRLNAGTGGRKRDDGSVQLDAAVATSDGRLGAIICIEETPNPIRGAAALLDESVHILAGDGARTWADARGFARAPVEGSERPSSTDTVGAVAIDASGALAVASSTGGCTGRPRGRVGDTPLFGPGFWCDEKTAIAATGIGEEITRKMLCHRVAVSHEAGKSVADAMQDGLALFDAKTEVGLIMIDANGVGQGLANTDMPWAMRD